MKKPLLLLPLKKLLAALVLHLDKMNIQKQNLKLFLMFQLYFPKN